MSEVADAKRLRRADFSPLADPHTCGEDLAGNLSQMISTAPEACAGCSDYHIFNAAKRLAGLTPWSHGGRIALVEMLGPLLRAAFEKNHQNVDILLAACADTAVLSTCTHAVLHQGGTLLERTRFVVVAAPFVAG